MILGSERHTMQFLYQNYTKTQQTTYFITWHIVYYRLRWTQVWLRLFTAFDRTTYKRDIRQPKFYCWTSFFHVHLPNLRIQRLNTSCSGSLLIFRIQSTFQKLPCIRHTPLQIWWIIPKINSLILVSVKTWLKRVSILIYIYIYKLDNEYIIKSILIQNKKIFTKNMLKHSL